MNNPLQDFVRFVGERDGINDKGALSQAVATQFGLTKDRSVFYCADFAVRFSASASVNFGNTVLSLSNLKKFDDRAFVVCLVTPTANHCFLANTTLLKKIRHSSQELRENNIKGSFNGSDIIRNLEGIPNNAANLERLFEIHAVIGFEGNLVRLVESTNNISPTGEKFAVGAVEETAILSAPKRAVNFVNSADAKTLKAELDAKVEKFKNEILLASLIESGKVRGSVIEYLIAGEDEKLRGELIYALQNRGKGIPAFKSYNALGDYQRIFDAYHTETDVKTKIMILNSNPKAYNIDKMLEFLTHEKSVFMFYFVGVDTTKIVNTVLVSMFETNLLDCTIVLRHWAGRNSRGVTQFEGRTINSLISSPAFAIDQGAAAVFLRKLIAL